VLKSQQAFVFKMKMQLFTKIGLINCSYHSHMSSRYKVIYKSLHFSQTRVSSRSRVSRTCHKFSGPHATSGCRLY